MGVSLPFKVPMNSKFDHTLITYFVCQNWSLCGEQFIHASQSTHTKKCWLRNL